MKTYKKTTISKLVDRFDNELRALLMEDLKAMRTAKDILINKLSTVHNQDSLTAA